MTAPATTPRADKIAEDLLRDARAFLQAEGRELHSRQVEALARAVARHLAALEDLMLCGWPQREGVLRAGTATGPIPGASECRGAEHLGVGWHCEKTGERGRAGVLPTPLRDVALGLEEPPPTPALPPMKIVQRWDRDAPENVPETEIAWGLDLHGDLEGKEGRKRALFSWGLCEAAPRGKRVPYVRKSPASPWGVRADVLGEGR